MAALYDRQAQTAFCPTTCRATQRSRLSDCSCALVPQNQLAPLRALAAGRLHDRVGGRWAARQSRASHVLTRPDSAGLHRSRVGSGKPNLALPSGCRVIYDIFEGTAEIQQLVIARAISGMQIK